MTGETRAAARVRGRVAPAALKSQANRIGGSMQQSSITDPLALRATLADLAPELTPGIIARLYDHEVEALVDWALRRLMEDPHA